MDEIAYVRLRWVSNPGYRWMSERRWVDGCKCLPLAWVGRRRRRTRFRGPPKSFDFLVFFLTQKKNPRTLFHFTSPDYFPLLRVRTTELQLHKILTHSKRGSFSFARLTHTHTPNTALCKKCHKNVHPKRKKKGKITFLFLHREYCVCIHIPCKWSVLSGSTVVHSIRWRQKNRTCETCLNWGGKVLTGVECILLRSWPDISFFLLGSRVHVMCTYVCVRVKRHAHSLSLDSSRCKND